MFGNELRSSRVGAGEFELKEGELGRIQFDAGPKLVCVGPAKGKLDANGTVTWEFGQLLAEVPDGEARLTVRSPAHTWDTNDGVFHLNLEPKGELEAYVSEGRLRVVESEQAESAAQLELSPAEFDQLVVKPSDDPAIPSVAIAKGKQQFLGQIGLGDATYSTTSPVQLDKVLGVVGENRGKLADPDYLRSWRKFAEQSVVGGAEVPFQDLLGGNNLGNAGFEGVLNINGQEMRFNSYEEFEKARRELLGLPGNDAGALFPFDKSGLKFTPPEQFKQLRERLQLNW